MIKAAYAILASTLSLLAASCGTPSTPGGSGGAASGGAAPGSGGAASGGATASGGAGSGGTSASGGANASGGTVGSGGAASGGASGSGGAGSGGDGTGGTPSSGGAEGSGGGGSLGCGLSTTAPSATQQQTLQVGGVTRYYLLYVPEGRDPNEPLPIVFGIHGLNMNNVWAAHDSSGFELIEATDDQAILIYPQGLPANGVSTPPSSQSQWGDADSNWGGPPPNADQGRLAADLEFFDAMIEHVTENYCVDETRIFSVGFSQGGFMTNALGCHRASVFRGLAPVAGWGPNGSNPTCTDASAVQAVLSTQGDTDGTVTPALGQATRDFWAGRAGCGSMEPYPLDSACDQYQDCADGKPVVYCTHGGDHFVPGGAGARAWTFFQSLD